MQYHPPKTGISKTEISYSPHDYEGHGIDYSILSPEGDKLDEYALQEKYMQNKKEDNPLSVDYHRLNKDEKPKESIEKNIAEEEKIKEYEGKDEKSNEEISKKKAELEINQEIAKTGFENSKKEKTIEDAIKAAIKQEQEVLVGK